jgi:L-amino acid N-acyltransferase YncA
MIRKATMDDLRAVVEMSEKFYPTTDYSHRVPFDPGSVGALVSGIIEHSVMLIAEDEDTGKIVGFAALAVVPFIFNVNYNAAHEIAWWVDPEASNKGHGLALLRAIEPACKEYENVAFIQMVKLRTSPPQVDLLYAKEGYILSETSFTKVV